MSLVGKDQETIVEAFKALAANAEKVKAQDIEIERLYSDLDILKEENHYLKNKLDYKRDVIEDLEQEIEKKDDEVKNAKKDVELKEKEFNDLEKFVLERVEEINFLRENNISLGKQIGEGINLEKKVVIQNNVIKELQDALRENENVANVEMTEEINNLIKEIEQLQSQNNEKERMLKSLNAEHDNLRNNVEQLEEKNIELKREIYEKEDNVQSVSEEMEQLIDFKITKPFKCKKCERTFDSRSDLRSHIKIDHEKEEWKLKVQEIERKLADQKFDIVSNLYCLKETEIKDSQKCRCRGFCRINHSKYNWSKSKTDEIISNLEDLNVKFAVNIIKKGTVNRNGAFKKKYSCDQCDETCVKQGELKKHKKTNHGTSTLTGA